MNYELYYYEKDIELEDADLEILLDAYKAWCFKNKENPECTNISEMIDSTSVLEHVLYHAEIEIKQNQDKPEYRLNSILEIFK